MEIESYLKHYEAFHKEFGIPTDPEAKRDKVTEELCEFLEAYEIGTKEQADKEAIDLMNASISNVVARGIHNPLFFGYLKLCETAEKYRLAKVGVTRYDNKSPEFAAMSANVTPVERVHKESNPRTYIDAEIAPVSRQVAGRRHENEHKLRG